MIVEIGDNNVEYAFWAGCVRVKVGTSVTFINVGDMPHAATTFQNGKGRGSSKGFRAWP